MPPFAARKDQYSERANKLSTLLDARGKKEELLLIYWPAARQMQWKRLFFLQIALHTISHIFLSGEYTYSWHMCDHRLFEQ